MTCTLQFTKNMENLLKTELGYTTLKQIGSGGGCINKGVAYETNEGKIYVKYNTNTDARMMFDGEYESVLAIMATNSVKIPKPIKVMDLPTGGAMFVMEYVKMHQGLSKEASLLGLQIAQMHKHNENLAKQAKNDASNIAKKCENELTYKSQFGFHVDTCCGYFPQSNNWTSDWSEFYAKKIEFHIGKIEKDYNDHSVRELWDRVLRKYSSLFEDLDIIYPALLHGDLWSGNISETSDGPVIFDPASFYGHSEYEFAISRMFGGFSADFFNSYHSVIPQTARYKERLELYKLFNYLNHWNHFGSGYKGSSINTLKNLVKFLGV